MSKLRSSLYRAARTLGDVEAASNGRYLRRVVRKRAYSKTLGGLGKLFR